MIASNILPDSQSVTNDSRIVLMLKKDVGRHEAKPIDTALLDQWSLVAGVDLAWEGNTRTHAQILRVPVGVDEKQARQVAEALSLQPGVLWANVRTPDRARITAAPSQSQPQSISRFVIKLRNDRLNEALTPDVLDRLNQIAGVRLSVTGRTALARILTLESSMSVEQARVQSVSVFTALLTNEETGVIEKFTWQYTQPSMCTTSLAGLCGPGIIDAKAAVQAVRDMQ